MITDFSFEIESIQSAMQIYDFRSCMMKVIKMRNKLAHELVDCNFNSQDIIESMSNENMVKYGEKYMQRNSEAMLDQMTKEVLSNLIYMDIIIKKLNEILERKVGE